MVIFQLADRISVTFRDTRIMENGSELSKTVATFIVAGISFNWIFSEWMLCWFSWDIMGSWNCDSLQFFINKHRDMNFTIAATVFPKRHGDCWGIPNFQLAWKSSSFLVGKSLNNVERFLGELICDFEGVDQPPEMRGSLQVQKLLLDEQGLCLGLDRPRKVKLRNHKWQRFVSGTSPQGFPVLKRSFGS